jgi:hypothetical protein
MLDEVERRHGAAPTQRASAWLIARSGVTAPVAAAFSGAQFVALIAATRLQFDVDARGRSTKRVGVPARPAPNTRHFQPSLEQTMTERSTRIRWNEEERRRILAAYQKLSSEDPKRGVAELFAAAQKVLPPPRRRALDYKLRAWLEGTSKHAGRPRRVPATTTVATHVPAAVAAGAKKRGKRALPPVATTASMAPAAPEPAKLRGARAAPDSVAIAQVMVEQGSVIVAGVLESARVQQALRALLRAVWPTTALEAPTPPLPPADAEPTAAAPSAPEPGTVPAAVPANGKLRVLIAGMEQREGAVLAKTYDDALDLVCWSAADGPELLPEALRRADVVVGMMGLLSQPVEQTLRRHAKRYLRNARGVAGLRSELAGLALSGNGASG